MGDGRGDDAAVAAVLNDNRAGDFGIFSRRVSDEPAVIAQAPGALGAVRQGRQLLFVALSSERTQPNVGTTYNTSGAGGGAEHGIHVRTGVPITLMWASVGLVGFPPSVSSAAGMNSRNLVVASSQYSMRRYRVSWNS